MRRRRLYIEIRINADLEDVWRVTQDPGLHQRWDLRFNRIDHLPPHGGRQPFRYTTLGVSGVGVSTGSRNGPDGGRTSALRFGSSHPLSPIRSGSGYWRYVPAGDAVRFLTSYDYRPRVLPRRVMWWATAWSFDRLRLWLETGSPPERSLRLALAEVAARGAAALVGAVALPPLPALAVLAAVLLLPPSPRTPAARRCLRRPPARTDARPPACNAARPHGRPRRRAPPERSRGAQQNPTARMGAPMPSIFQRALGRAFDRLHPQLQHRFGVGLDSGRACIGTGVMTRVWNAGLHIRPFLALGSRRNVLVQDAGADIPFRIENYPYLDSYGRETVTFVRTFPKGRFDATMIYDDTRAGIVDYLGTHQHIATPLDLAVDDRGGLVIRSGRQRFLEGPLAVAIPKAATGTAIVSEHFDERAERFRIAVTVSNPWLGRIFGYWGSFTAEYVDVAEHGVPANVRPRREDARC